jgi:hypothetical protein
MKTMSALFGLHLFLSLHQEVSSKISARKKIFEKTHPHAVLENIKNNLR